MPTTTDARRPTIRTTRGWAISVLREARAVRECEKHGWMQDRTDPHAREHAIDIARSDPPPGLSPDPAVAEIREVLDSIGDTCHEKVPSGERWIHEIKFDGYRVQVHLADESVKIFTRRGNDWSKRFKKVAHDAWRIRAASQSSMARSWCLPPTAPPISRCCRTS